MSGTTTTAPSLDGLGLRPVETRPPNTGRNIESALAEMQRRRGGLGGPAMPAPTASHAVAMTAPTPFQQLTQPGAAPQLPPPDAMMPAQGPVGPVGAPQPAPVSQAAGGSTGSENLVVQLEIDGQLVPVTVGELQRGYLREQDYRRKTQGVQQEQRKAQEAQARYQALAQQLEQRLPAFGGQYAHEFSQPIDWEKLGREDPIGTGQKVTRLLAWQQAQAEQQALEQQKQRDQVAHKSQLHALGHDVLCRLIPGWSDPPTRQAIQQALGQHAISMGYSPEQVAKAEILDPRDVWMCWKSWNYDRLMSQRVVPQPVGTPTHAGNGAYRRQAVGSAPALDELEARFQQTHRLEDALAIARVRREQDNRQPAAPMPMGGRYR